MLARVAALASAAHELHAAALLDDVRPNPLEPDARPLILEHSAIERLGLASASPAGWQRAVNDCLLRGEHLEYEDMRNDLLSLLWVVFAAACADSSPPAPTESVGVAAQELIIAVMTAAR